MTQESLSTKVPGVILNDGKWMPTIGLGTYLGWNLGPEVKDQLIPAIEKAIDIGYRHIDTATIYENEELVGKAVLNKISSGFVKRNDLFITTKLWIDHHHPEKVEKALRESLNKMGLEYVDLYLIHWPVSYDKRGNEEYIDYIDTWRALEELQRKKLTVSIGVSNFNIDQLRRLIENSTVKPAVLQIEVHLSLTQEALVKFAQDNGISVTAYTPLGYLPSSRIVDNPPPPSMDEPILNDLAKKYNKSVTQIALRYLVDRGMSVIPKSLNGERLRSNIDIFGFSLLPQEIALLGKFDSGSRFVRPEFWQDHPNYPFEKTGKPTPVNIFKTDS